jgi:hypothetical protein
MPVTALIAVIGTRRGRQHFRQGHQPEESPHLVRPQPRRLSKGARRHLGASGATPANMTLTELLDVRTIGPAGASNLTRSLAVPFSSSVPTDELEKLLNLPGSDTNQIGSARRDSLVHPSFSKRRCRHLIFGQMTDGRQGPACDICARRITHYVGRPCSWSMWSDETLVW